jgi:putative copper export protein
MRKYLAAAAVGATLMAGQAAAYDGGLIGVGDRIGSSAAASDNLESANGNTWLFVAAALVLVITVAVIANDRNHPSSP